MPFVGDHGEEVGRDRAHQGVPRRGRGRGDDFPLCVKRGLLEKLDSFHERALEVRGFASRRELVRERRVHAN